MRELLLPGHSSRRVAMAFASAVVLFIVATDFRLRTRDASLTLERAVDAQILFELAVTAALGGWIALRRLLLAAARDRRPDRVAAYRLRRRSLLRLLRLIGVGILVSSLWSPTASAPVRAVQFLVMVELVVEIASVCQLHPSFFDRFWKATRRIFLAAVAIAGIASFALPYYQPFETQLYPIPRLRFLAIHPMITAHLLGVAVVMLFEPVVRAWGKVPTNNRHWAYPWANVAGGLLGLVLLLMTRERASFVATASALVVLVALAPNRHRFRTAVLSASLAGFVVVLLFASPIYKFASRGQSAEQLSTLSGRMEILAETRQLFAERPFTGHGYVAGRSVFLEKIPWAGESHALVVEIIVSLGLVGLLAYAVLGWRWMRQVRSALRSPNQRRRRYGVESAALVVLVTVFGLASDTFAGPPGLEPMVLLMGFLMVGEGVLTHRQASQVPFTSLPYDRQVSASTLRPRHSYPAGPLTL